MAMEVPVIATKVGGVPRLLRDRVNGLLVEPNVAETLTEALEHLLKDEKLRANLAQAGRATVAAKFSFEARMQKVRAIYDRIIEEGKRLCSSR